MNNYAILTKVIRKVYTMIENKFRQLGLSNEVLRAIPSFEAVIILSSMPSPYPTWDSGLFLMSIFCSFCVVYCYILWYNVPGG